jgi:hypothetical protein
VEVKVQYVVDIEEIPTEVQKLLPVVVDLEDRLHNLGGLIGEKSIGLALDEIDVVRKLMYRTDQRLADCQGILKGYLGVKSQPSISEQPAAPENGVENDSAS